MYEDVVYRMACWKTVRKLCSSVFVEALFAGLTCVLSLNNNFKKTVNGCFSLVGMFETPQFWAILSLFFKWFAVWVFGCQYRSDVHENYSGAIRSCSIKHPNTPLEAPWGVLDFHVYTLRFLCAWVCWTTAYSGNKKQQRRWKGRCGKAGEKEGVGLHPGKIQHWKMGTLEKEVWKKVPYVFFQLFPLGLLSAYEFEASSFIRGHWWEWNMIDMSGSIW